MSKPRMNELLISELEFIDHVNQITDDSVSLWNCCQAYLDQRITTNMTDQEVLQIIGSTVQPKPVVAKRKSYYKPKPKTTNKPKPLF